MTVFIAISLPYTDALLDAGIRSLFIGGVWPSTKIAPEEMGTEGMSGDHLDYVETQLKKRRREEPGEPDDRVWMVR